jgi:hypothetical protein
VAYDEKLAARIRELLARERGVKEQRMFGGLAFLVGGNMAIAASGGGGALVRCDPHESDDLGAGTPATLFEMRGRQMQGWTRELRRPGVEARARAVGRPRRHLRALPPREAVARRLHDLARTRDRRVDASGRSVDAETERRHQP